MDTSTTATFIGHSEYRDITETDVKNSLREIIDKGVTDFISGGQGGFDWLCARCVFELKQEYPHLKSYLVIPYLNFRVWNKRLFDSTIYPEGFELYHYKAAIPARNKYLVDHAAYALCYVDHNWGGAATTYRRACKKNLYIINLAR